MEDNCLDEPHLPPGVFKDDWRILAGAPEQVGREDGAEVGGVHLGDGGHVGAREQLEESGEEGEDEAVRLWEAGGDGGDLGRDLGRLGVGEVAHRDTSAR